MVCYFRPANGLEGHYRFILAGADHVTVKVMVTDIFSLPQLEGLELFGQFVPGHQVPKLYNLYRSMICSYIYQIF
jgi:hypothetical protein